MMPSRWIISNVDSEPRDCRGWCPEPHHVGWKCRNLDLSIIHETEHPMCPKPRGLEEGGLVIQLFNTSWFGMANN